ncbi:N-6 DNA methylase [Roseiconus lacunae]|uniref:N-6 DNA methylase n=1 Tax=Roseiconus lacunae TaxID=2605694 RepID=A0ABT7PHH0_9BACT|nr:N-6 DNA methylase [Roseiconus lacunae]MDM4015935.1 N-6 DNA methylase [Roseiconus lacunae]
MAGGRYRKRKGETLFLDARKMGSMIDRVHRELTDDDIKILAGTYRGWQGNPHLAGSKSKKAMYSDVVGFCKSATKDEIAEHGYVLTPGRYVGAEAVEEDDEPFDDKMKRLVGDLKEQFKELAQLEAVIRCNLEGLGYGQ